MPTTDAQTTEHLAPPIPFGNAPMRNLATGVLHVLNSHVGGNYESAQQDVKHIFSNFDHGAIDMVLRRLTSGANACFSINDGRLVAAA